MADGGGGRGRGPRAALLGVPEGPPPVGGGHDRPRRGSARDLATMLGDHETGGEIELTCIKYKVQMRNNRGRLD